MINLPLLMMLLFEDFILTIFACMAAFSIVGMISTPFLIHKRGIASFWSSVLTGGMYFSIGGIVVVVISKITLLLRSPAVNEVFQLGYGLLQTLPVLGSHLTDEIVSLILYLLYMCAMITVPTAIVGGMLGAFIQQKGTAEKDYLEVTPNGKGI